MGGYGGFVWPAYGVSAIVLVGLIVMTVRSMRAREAELANLQAVLGSRRAAAQAQRSNRKVLDGDA
ncbi:MAG: heme exporter protein CcmD [Alphaproteobacteria bacterium]|nr:heme exporter protein CcmD [Alphaproteobacteria bacterium]